MAATAKKFTGTLISLELNELNFDFVQSYCDTGRLPTFKKLLSSYQLFETVAEKQYPYLEPWIQWPTVYSGKTFAEHGMFRLGDVSEANYDQIWEVLERAGVSVGAISPMNASNRGNPDFFVPDPWTKTAPAGGASLEKLYHLVSKVVNENAHGNQSMAVIGAKLLPFLLRYALPSSIPQFLQILRSAYRHKWARAAVLDRLLADLLIRLRRQHGTMFSSLFLNAGAHIQHHHMFDASVYNGPNGNPEWYSDARSKGIDPLLFIYSCYDRILADMLGQPNTRVMVTTGLSQYPNDRCVYQYRFHRHAASLERLCVTEGEVNPRMSRDFLITFDSEHAASEAQHKLAGAQIGDVPLFNIDNRGTTLFCQIGYFGPAEGFANVKHEGRTIDLTDDVVLVSVENGLHRTTGFHIDTAIPAQANGDVIAIPLTEVFARMKHVFIEDVKDETSQAARAQLSAAV